MAKFDLLNKQHYMNLTTYRKTGAPMVTPVWFALDSDKNRVVVVTAPVAGKLKRIRNNPQVEVGPADMRGRALGATISGQAHTLHDDESKIAEALLNRKYGLMKKLWTWFVTRGKPMAYIEII